MNILNILKNNPDFLSPAEQKRETLLLTAFIRKMSIAQLITRGEHTLTPGEDRKLQDALARRSRGEPLAYILGSWQFYRDDYICDTNVLAPRNDSECLIDRVLEDTGHHRKLLEIGTGSGVLALSIARARKDWRITATDISRSALCLAKRNANRLGLSSVRFLHGDLFECVPPYSSAKYHVILSNPPYVAADAYLTRPYLRHEPRRALFGGGDGLECIRQILQSAPAYLVRDGRVILEHGYNQAERVRSIAQALGYTRLSVIRDLAGRARGLEARFFARKK